MRETYMILAYKTPATKKENVVYQRGLSRDDIKKLVLKLIDEGFERIDITRE